MPKTSALDKIDNIADFQFPDADFFKKPPKSEVREYRKKEGNKHNSAYTAYIKWSAMPKDLRDPKTKTMFEKTWKLPKGYCYTFEKRADFYEKKMKYFWDWVMDKFPDVVHAVYRRAITNSTADARIFADLVKQRMESFAPPKAKMTPFVMVGVPQDKINALFTPEGYEEAQEAELADDK